MTEHYREIVDMFIIGLLLYVIFILTEDPLFGITSAIIGGIAALVAVSEITVVIVGAINTWRRRKSEKKKQEDMRI